MARSASATDGGLGDADVDHGALLVTRHLQSRIASLPSDLLTGPARPLRERLSHTQMQLVVFAAQRIVPHLSRAALTECTTRDLAEWLAPALEKGATVADEGVAARPPRGSYTTPSVTLRPLLPSDVDLLYLAALRPQSAHRWRFRGQTPSPEQFRAELFSPAVLCQFMVEDLEGGTTIGLVSAYDASAVSRHCAVAMQRLDLGGASTPTGGLMIEGVAAFIQYLFDHFDFSKLYFEVPEYNSTLFSGGVAGTLLSEEGRFIDHLYFGDRAWDKITYALYRHKWEDIADEFRGQWPQGHFDRTE